MKVQVKGRKSISAPPVHRAILDRIESRGNRSLTLQKKRKAETSARNQNKEVNNGKN